MLYRLWPCGRAQCRHLLTLPTCEYFICRFFSSFLLFGASRVRCQPAIEPRCVWLRSVYCERARAAAAVAAVTTIQHKEEAIKIKHDRKSVLLSTSFGCHRIWSARAQIASKINSVSFLDYCFWFLFSFAFHLSIKCTSISVDRRRLLDRFASICVFAG